MRTATHDFDTNSLENSNKKVFSYRGEQLNQNSMEKLHKTSTTDLGADENHFERPSLSMRKPLGISGYIIPKA